MKKRNILILIVVVVLFVAVVLFCNTKWGKEHVYYPMQAKSKAMGYIQQKYGFRPKVKSVEILVKDNSGSPIFALPVRKPLEKAWIVMEYEGKEFEVYINWGKEREQYDNYQQDVIAQAVKDEITEMIGEPVYIYVNSGLSSKLFDGSNLLEVLETSLFETNTAYIVMINADLSRLTNDEIVAKFGKNCNYDFLNCKDKDALDKIMQLETDDFISSQDVEIYAPYLKEYVEFGNNLTNGRNYYRMGQCENFEYTCFNGSYCKMERAETTDLSKWDEESKLIDYVAEERYFLETDAERVTVFFPCDKYGIKNEKDINLIQLYTKEGHNGYRHERGNYIEENHCVAVTIYLKDHKDVSFVIDR